MADPTAALHGVVKSETSTSATNTLVSDSASLTANDWLVVLLGGAFADASLGATTFSIAKTAGTSTVGAQVTPTSPLSTVALAQVLGGGVSLYAKAMYLPVTGSGTGTFTVTRTAGSIAHAWVCAFVRVQNPFVVGAVGNVTDAGAATTTTVTLDNAPEATSLLLMLVADNGGSAAITPPAGTTELSDTNLSAFGFSAETAKKEGTIAAPPATANQFSALNSGSQGHAAVVFEVRTTPVWVRNTIIVPQAAVGRASRW
jgi:hypothetical protein